MSIDGRRVKFNRQRIIKFTPGRSNSSLKISPTPPRFSSPSVDALMKDSPEYLNVLINKLFTLSIKKYGDSLPSLSSSANVDTQLYALIGLLFKSFINRWYNNITDDQKLIADVLKLISHLIKEIEIRLKRLNILSLLLDDVPYLLDNHLNTYRKIDKELGSSILPYDSPEIAFYSLSNHIGLSEDALDEQRYLRVLTKSLVNELIPKSDLNSQLAYKFLNSLLSDLILTNIIEKVSQPYQIFEIFQLVCGLLLREKSDEIKPTGFSDKFQSTYQSLINLIKPKNTTIEILSYHLFPFLSNLLRIESQRPYLYSLLKTISNLQSARINTILSNVFNGSVLEFFQNEDFFVLIIKALRNNLFPTDDCLGAPRIEPTLKEFQEIRKTTKNMLKGVCNKYGVASSLLISSNEFELDQSIEEFLTSFENKAINKVLIFKLIDILIIRLLPELTTP